MNGIGRGGLICIALLFFVLTGSGIAHAATHPGEGVQIDPANDEALLADTESARQIVLEQPEVRDTVAYHGSKSAFSVAYKPVLLWYALGAVIALSVGYFLIRKYRRGDLP